METGRALKWIEEEKKKKRGNHEWTRIDTNKKGRNPSETDWIWSATKLLRDEITTTGGKNSNSPFRSYSCSIVSIRG